MGIEKNNHYVTHLLTFFTTPRVFCVRSDAHIAPCSLLIMEVLLRKGEPVDDITQLHGQLSG